MKFYFLTLHQGCSSLTEIRAFFWNVTVNPYISA
jgi:hypothetical protein